MLADPKYRDALLKEGIETMLAGVVDGGKAVLCNYIKAKWDLKSLALTPARRPTA